MHQNSEDRKYTEGPGKYGRKMFHDHVTPQMLLNEMVGREKQHPENYQPQHGEHNVHPVLAQKVDSAGILHSHRLLRVFMFQISTGEGGENDLDLTPMPDTELKTEENFKPASGTSALNEEHLFEDDDDLPTPEEADSERDFTENN